MQYSTAIRNARSNAIESTIGASAKLRIYSGAKPATVAEAATGSLLVEMTLPADWMAAAASGAAAKSGTWSGTGAAAAGAGTDGGYFRIVDSAGTTPGVQGTVTGVGGGGDMTLDNISIAENQVVTVNTFQITDGNV